MPKEREGDQIYDTGFEIHDAGWAIIAFVVLFGGACVLIYFN